MLRAVVATDPGGSNFVKLALALAAAASPRLAAIPQRSANFLCGRCWKNPAAAPAFARARQNSLVMEQHPFCCAIRVAGGGRPLTDVALERLPLRGRHGHSIVLVGT